MAPASSLANVPFLTATSCLLCHLFTAIEPQDRLESSKRLVKEVENWWGDERRRRINPALPKKRKLLKR